MTKLLTESLRFLAGNTYRGSATTARSLEALRRSPLDTKLLSIVVAPLVVFLTLLLSHKKGETDAAADYQHPRESIFLTIKRDDISAFEPQLLTANAGGKLMLLDQSKELIWAFVKGSSNKPPEGIFIIPRANLLATHIRKLR